VTTKPSYDLKFDRAEEHLVDLEAAVRAYVDSHPYEVRVRRQGRKKPRVHRLHFTRQPSDAVALIAADVIYNIRSGLDHLAAALVPARDRDSVMFPIFFQGVWEESIGAENLERRKQRSRWRTVTRNMPREAVAILKMVQPPDEAIDLENLHGAIALNRLSNTDRHSKLPVISTTLSKPIGSCRTPDGQAYIGRALGGDEGLEDGAELVLPHGAVDVQLSGTPEVVIHVGAPHGGYLIPGMLRDELLRGARQLADQLRPFDRRHRGNLP
jgi:hypothetical protein